MVDDKIEERVIAYAGRNYAKPREVVVEALDFINDLEGMDLSGIVETINNFANRVAGHRLEYEFCNGHCASASVTAYRPETGEEIAARVAEYRDEAAKYIAMRRADFERMKREFGEG